MMRFSMLNYSLKPGKIVLGVSDQRYTEDFAFAAALVIPIEIDFSTNRTSLGIKS